MWNRDASEQVVLGGLLMSEVGGRESLTPQATSGRDHEGDQLRLLEKSITQIYPGYKAEQGLLLEGQRRGGLRAWASRRLCHPPFPGHTRRPPRD